LTAGFVGKFYVISAGVGSALWLAVIALAINSVIGLFYYLRIIVALYSRREDSTPGSSDLSRIDSAALFVLTILLLWLGVYPGPVIGTIKTAMPF
jgi:NADH-quinone oxidoreductase subunit N